MNRMCEISSTTFGGYQYQVDIVNIENLDEIISLVISDLRAVLYVNNLLSLITQLDNKKWHMHDISLDEIISHPDSKIWICDHC